MTSLSDRMRNLVRRVAGVDRFELVARLTLIVLLLRSAAVWYVQIPVIPLCAAGLLFPRICRRFSFWALIVAVLAVAYARNWFAIDNHDFLLGYLCLSLALSRVADDGLRALRVSARALVGLTFLFAVIWRVISPDFLSGDFFHFAFLTNTRFQWIASAAGSLSTESMLHNDTTLAAVVSDPRTTGTLITTRVIGVLALVVTWVIFALESLIAVTFLAPRTTAVQRTGHIALVAFLVTVYAAASVVTFGWVLAILGIAALDRDRNETVLAYLVAMVVVWLGVTPWGDVLQALS